MDILKSQALNYLESLVQSKANRINAFLDERKDDAVFLSQTDEIKEAFNESVLISTKAIKEVVEKRAKQTAADVERYILAHPNMTLEELQNDSNFKKIAIRRVGQTGYTVFYGPETFINYLHFLPKETNTNHDAVWNDPAQIQVAKLLLTAAKTGKDVSGFYHRIQNKNEREKFMYIHMIPGRYFGGIKLSIKSTIYIDEFGKTTKIASDLDRELEGFQAEKDYFDIILINPNGDIVWTAEQDNDLGTNLETGLYNDTNLAKAYEITKNKLEAEVSEPEYYEAGGKISIFITQPIFNTNTKTKNNTLIGILALQINNNQIKKLVETGAELVDSEEIYIVNKNREYISPILYGQMDDKGESHRISSEQIEKCIADYNSYVSLGQETNSTNKSGDYINYAGIEVLGAYQYSLQSGWCIFAELNKKEFILSRFSRLSLSEKSIICLFIILFIVVLISIIVFDNKFKIKRRVVV